MFFIKQYAAHRKKKEGADAKGFAVLHEEYIRAPFSLKTFFDPF